MIAHRSRNGVVSQTSAEVSVKHSDAATESPTEFRILIENIGHDCEKYEPTETRETKGPCA